MPDMVVNGAGVVGAATAHALTQAGVSVTVLEAEEIAGGVSAATFAMDISRLKPPR
jgi:glycine/D-amino acid oxidase-like deaminating enzyme